MTWYILGALGFFCVYAVVRIWHEHRKFNAVIEDLRAAGKSLDPSSKPEG